MGAVRVVGPRNVSATRDEQGHRVYTVDWLINLENPLDGPAHILANWPLPVVGAPYSFGNDSDPWAFCTPELNIAPHSDVTEGDPILDYIVTQKWSTNPGWRCQTFPIENPLLEPVQYSGDFVHEQIQKSEDIHGNPLIYPNYEPIAGQLVEQKFSYPTINITFNSATLPLSTYALLVNRLNDRPLWGVPARCIRFADAKWERLVYGTCFYYFRTTYSFEINIDTFDPVIPAFGNKCLRDGGDRNNPEDYVLFKNRDGDYTGTMLDAEGKSVNDKALQYKLRPQLAKVGNLLLLGIPPTLN